MSYRENCQHNFRRVDRDSSRRPPEPGEDPLTHRLRTMRWAEPSPEVKQRCLERIMAQLAETPPSPEDAPAPVERIDRYEYTRRSLRPPSTLPAPALQPRFGVAL